MSGLTRMSTATYSTKRSPAAAAVTGKRGDSVAYLTGVKCTPVMSPGGSNFDTKSLAINEPIRGQVKKVWETFAEYQAHTEDGQAVTQVPDIREGDVMVIGSDDWGVRVVREWTPTTTLLGYIHVTLEQPVKW